MPTLVSSVMGLYSIMNLCQHVAIAAHVMHKRYLTFAFPAIMSLFLSVVQVRLVWPLAWDQVKHLEDANGFFRCLAFGNVTKYHP